MKINQMFRDWRIRRKIEKSDLFHASYYLDQLQDGDLQGLDPMAHYLRTGAEAGLAPNPFFDSAWYLRTYPDVAAARLNPLLHYVQYGAAELRDPGPLFSTSRYLAKYPDVRKTGLSPLVHYLKHGIAEGRDPQGIVAGAATKSTFNSWNTEAPEPYEVHPLFLEEEADAWAEEMRAVIERDKADEVQRMIDSELGREIDQRGAWYQRIDFPAFGIATTSNHALVKETPGSLNRLGNRLTPLEASIVRPWPKWKYIERVLPEVAGKSVLEIGSANGFFSTQFAYLGAAKVTGVELVEGQVKAATWAAGVLGLDQVSYLHTDALIDQSIPPHDIVFLSEVHNHFPLPFLGFLRLANLATEFLVFDNSGTNRGHVPRMRYNVIGDPELDAIHYIHCNVSERLMIQFMKVIGIDNEAIKAYYSPVSTTHVLYVIDVRKMRERRAEIQYPEYLKKVFEHF